jgi:phosphotransferase system enzyme I (PtsP)
VLLRLLRDVVPLCDDSGIPLSLCGEMAGQPLEAMALIGIGFRHLSMNANAVGGIRLMTRSLDTGAFGDYLATILDGDDHRLRSKLLAFATDRGIAI